MSPIPPIAAGPGALSPLLAPLAIDRQVLVDSDAVHALAVAAALPTGAGVPTPKAAITAVPEVHGTQLVAPGELLLELAEASTPAVLPPGMRDLSLRWAWLRYCWSFSTPPAPPAVGPLLLSAPARAMAQHHKQVASDHLGVAFGLVLARRALEARYAPATTTIHDAEEVIDGAGLGAWGFSHGGGLRPDYFIRVAKVVAGAPWSTVWVLECKGTHGTGHLDQLRKGVTQTATITNAATGAQAKSMVSAAIFSTTRTRVRLVDPPGDDDDPWAGPEEEGAVRSTLRVAKDHVEVDGVSGFREELAELDVAGILAFAGLYLQAANALPARIREIAGTGETVRDATLTSSSGPLPASGTNVQLPLLGGEHLRALCAVDQRVLDAARDRDRAGVAQARASIRAEREQGSVAPFRRAVIGLDSATRMRVRSSSGLVLELDVA